MFITWIGENVWVELAIALGKRFHHPVDFLSFTRKAEAP